MYAIYFDKGRRMVQVALNEVAETMESLAARGFTTAAVEILTYGIYRPQPRKSKRRKR